MNLPLSFAFRYLFSKKSLNAVNIVSAISMIAVAVVAKALIIVLSIYNGYEQIIIGQTSDLDPDLLVERIDGKPITAGKALLEKCRNLPELAVATPILRENALVRAGGNQVTARLIGVGDDFSKVSSVAHSVWQGEFVLKGEYLGDSSYFYNVGSQLLSSIPEASSVNEDIYLYLPKRVGVINPLLPASALSIASGHISSVIMTGQPAYDANLILSIEQLRDLLSYDDDVCGTIALKVKPGYDQSEVKSKVAKLINSDGIFYKVLDRLEQHPDIAYIVSLEKWMTFLILIFVLLLALFNVVSSLSMLMIEKRQDISNLRAIGMPDKMIGKIFLFEGTMVSAIGTFCGLVIGVIIAITQQNYGWLGDPNAPIPEYPMIFQLKDLLISFIVIIGLGILSAYYPVRLFIRKNK